MPKSEMKNLVCGEELFVNEWNFSTLTNLLIKIHVFIEVNENFTGWGF